MSYHKLTVRALQLFLHTAVVFEDMGGAESKVRSDRFRIAGRPLECTKDIAHKQLKIYKTHAQRLTQT